MKPHSLHLAFRPACLGRCYRAATRGWGGPCWSIAVCWAQGGGTCRKVSSPPSLQGNSPQKPAMGLFIGITCLTLNQKLLGCSPLSSSWSTLLKAVTDTSAKSFFFWKPDPVLMNWLNFPADPDFRGWASCPAAYLLVFAACSHVRLCSNCWAESYSVAKIISRDPPPPSSHYV